jgi:DNA topoisomerase-1
LQLAKHASQFTVATDYDVEGEVIGKNIVEYIFHRPDAARMKFSTLTKQELEESYEHKSPALNWSQAIAGETRHYLDWFYGINLSRALMNALKKAGAFKIMSIGRVQGPTLHILVERERQIQKFKPEPYWQIFITIKNSHELELKYNKDIFDLSELRRFEDLVNKTAEVTIERREEIIPPGFPFDLTTLQTESYKFHNFTPSKTLQIAQSLYLAGLISYPRTSSQKLPEAINYHEILKKMAKEYSVEHLINRVNPVEGPKTDPAHPSIYPTGEFPGQLTEDEEKLYNLIVRRFLALFCSDAVLYQKKIKAMVNELIFAVRGTSIKEKGWMAVYPAKLKEIDIPDIEGKVLIIKQRAEEKETQPPKRYTSASLVAELERRNLGTKATRAAILETLYERGYIKEKSIEVTPLGMSLINTLEKYSPIIIDQQLTRNFEKEMESIEQAKKNTLEEKEQKIINDAKKTITNIIHDFEKHEGKIGAELVEANKEVREQEKLENILMQCPVCKNGQLTIMYSKKTRRQFIGCNHYPECKTTFSLPPNGIIKKTEKICEQCSYPMLMRLAKGKRPWIFCFNPQCPSRKNIEKAERQSEI